jgi:hypothetical protein
MTADLTHRDVISALGQVSILADRARPSVTPSLQPRNWGGELSDSQYFKGLRRGVFNFGP